MSQNSAPKPPTTFVEQLAKLESRGLAIPDREKALHCLAHANYFRLSCYHPPLQEADGVRFRSGATFEQLWTIYRFDHRLRMLLMDVIERCEISFRTQWAYELAHRHGPQAYENSSIHQNRARHGETLAKIDEEIKRSRESFIREHQASGGSRPPIWVVCEVTSLGQLSSLYDNLKESADRQIVANAYELDETIFASFLHHLTVIRNLCAHHSRCWNRKIGMTFKVPRKKPSELVPNFHPGDKRIYNAIVMLAYLLNRIEPENHWTRRMIQLIEETDFDVAPQMGFPSDWKTRPIWRV